MWGWSDGVKSAATTGGRKIAVSAKGYASRTVNHRPPYFEEAAAIVVEITATTLAAPIAMKESHGSLSHANRLSTPQTTIASKVTPMIPSRVTVESSFEA